MSPTTSKSPIETEAYVARGDNSIPKLEPVTFTSLGPHDVLVDIVAASICHSDIKAATGNFHMRPPLIIGHEASGHIKTVGSNVTYVKEGDPVVLSYASCGECRRCLQGSNAYCDEIMGLNFGGEELENGTKAGFFGQSSLSRVAKVRESCCVKVEGLSREELVLCASLGCGVQTGAGAILNVATPPPNSRIAIFGGGAVGLSALLAAKLLSPSLLVLIDNSATKLSIIPKSILQDVYIVDSSTLQEPGQLSQHLLSLTPGFDLALDCVGHTSILSEAHASLFTLSTLINVGASPTASLSGISTTKQLVRGITIRGTHQGDSVSRIMVPKLIDLWKRGKFPFEALLGRYRFEDLEGVWRDLGEGRVVKPVLVV